MKTVHVKAAASMSAIALLTACAQTPTKELSLIEARVQRAREAEAALYAPEPLAQAEAALHQAKTLVTERRHRDAIRAASNAALYADEASERASTARALVLRDVKRLIHEIEELLDMSAARGAGASEATARELVLLTERYQQILLVWKNGDLLDALEQASAFKPQVIEFEKRFR